MGSLFLAPHNLGDDEVLFGTFTLLREEPYVIVCLRSARMGQPNYPKPHIDAETRERETDRAMNIIGLDWTQWPYLDSAPDWDEIAEHLEVTRRTWGDPLHVYAPAVEDGGHEQHNRIGELADLVFEHVIHYTTYVNGTQRSSGETVPYEPEWLDLKRQALGCYQSQIAHPMTGHHFSAPLDEFYAL